jgi:hypothetical protein
VKKFLLLYFALTGVNSSRIAVSLSTDWFIHSVSHFVSLTQCLNCTYYTESNCVGRWSWLDNNKEFKKTVSLILIYVQRDATLHSLFYLETALHVPGGTITHHQEREQLYLQHLAFVTPLLLPAPLAADSSNGVTNTRCCIYSCLRSWWWVVVPPKTCRAVSR